MTAKASLPPTNVQRPQRPKRPKTKSSTAVRIKDQAASILPAGLACTCRYNDWCSAAEHVDLRGFKS